MDMRAITAQGLCNKELTPSACRGADRDLVGQAIEDIRIAIIEGSIRQGGSHRGKGGSI